MSNSTYKRRYLKNVQEVINILQIELERSKKEGFEPSPGITSCLHDCIKSHAKAEVEVELS